MLCIGEKKTWILKVNKTTKNTPSNFCFSIADLIANFQNYSLPTNSKKRIEILAKVTYFKIATNTMDWLKNWRNDEDQYQMNEPIKSIYFWAHFKMDIERTGKRYLLALILLTE